MERDTWNALIAGLPAPHLLQTWQWGELKSAYGWQMLPRSWQAANGKTEAAALVLERVLSIGRLQLPIKILYAPRGPLLDWANPAARAAAIAGLKTLAHRRGAVFIKIDPEVIVGRGVPSQPEAAEEPLGTQVKLELQQAGWLFSNEQIQFRNTVWLDISGSEDEILAGMKQKARYNLRLAQRKGVTVRPAAAAELPQLYRLYAETATRDGFVIRPQEYYLQLWRSFMTSGMAYPLLALVDGEIVAGLVLFVFAGKAWYLQGMSRPLHRDKMPNYLLQWEAIRLARAAGARTYDLWGAPDSFDQPDALSGVYRFKEGWGGQVIRTLGAWDYPARPAFYRLYTQILPRLLDRMRLRGMQRTRQEVA